MASSRRKLVLSRSQDIPFNKLVLSLSNVRRVKVGLSIEEPAQDIAHRGLLPSPKVRPILDAEGVETGMFEIPAGGRRYRAPEALVKQKRMAKTTPVPCMLRERGDTTAEEDSVAENVQRVNLHPLDQFRSFQTLREQGLGEEEIAARFRKDTSIRLEQGVLFTTYATLRIDGREERVSRAAQIVEWLESDFDGVIVLDESHTILGAVMERYPLVRIVDRAAA